MQAAIDKIMQVYELMVNLKPEQAQEARRRLTLHLQKSNAREQALVVEGLKFLRKSVPSSSRSISPS